jgi:hypothetical protein
MFGPPARKTSKFEPMLQRECPSGRIMTYVLPVGHVYDLSSLRVHLICHHEATTAPGPISTIPSPAECLIDTLNVSLGSYQMNQLNNYGQLFAAWSRFNTPSKDFGRRMMTSAASSSMQQPNNRRDKGSMRVVLSSWLGLLGSGAHIDTELRGPLKIEMVLGDEGVTGTPFIYHSFMTIDELPFGIGNDIIPYADYRTSLTYNVGQAPSGVLQTDNTDDHRLQYVLATMLHHDYRDPNKSVEPVQDLGFTHGFRHSRMNIHDYHFEFDGHRYTHDIEYWEFLDRLREALADSGGQYTLELPLLMARGNDMQLSELCNNIFLAGESSLGKGIPDGTLEVAFKTRCESQNTRALTGTSDCYVFMVARYMCFA